MKLLVFIQVWNEWERLQAVKILDTLHLKNLYAYRLHWRHDPNLKVYMWTRCLLTPWQLIKLRWKMRKNFEYVHVNKEHWFRTPCTKH